MSNTLDEIARTAGKICGTLAKDVAGMTESLLQSFERGWKEGFAEKPKTGPTEATSGQTAEPA